ncbi:hypothetical protein G6F68_012465 [Rhizopus microsporus]|nr:hypothetical protein G6F68_012465 [Rhizopus microsporus]
MLVLDEPLMGLDVEHRQQILDVLGTLATQSSIPVVLVLRPQDEFPSWATHVIELQEMAIHWEGKPDEYQARRQQARKEREKKRVVRVDRTDGEAVVEMKDVKVIIPKPMPMIYHSLVVVVVRENRFGKSNREWVL